MSTYNKIPHRTELVIHYNVKSTLLCDILLHDHHREKDPHPLNHILVAHIRTKTNSCCRRRQVLKQLQDLLRSSITNDKASCHIVYYRCLKGVTRDFEIITTMPWNHTITIYPYYKTNKASVHDTAASSSSPFTTQILAFRIAFSEERFMFKQLPTFLSFCCFQLR